MLPTTGEGPPSSTKSSLSESKSNIPADFNPPKTSKGYISLPFRVYENGLAGASNILTKRLVHAGDTD